MVLFFVIALMQLGLPHLLFFLSENIDIVANTLEARLDSESGHPVVMW
jgi:hypothetical protein